MLKVNSMNFAIRFRIDLNFLQNGRHCRRLANDGVTSTDIYVTIDIISFNLI